MILAEDFRLLDALTAQCHAYLGEWDRFAAALQKAGPEGMDFQLESREDADTLLEALSHITRISDADRHLIMNAAAVEVKLGPVQKLNERSISYDKEGRITRIVDTPFFAGKMLIECFDFHTDERLLGEDIDG